MGQEPFRLINALKRSTERTYSYGTNVPVPWFVNTVTECVIIKMSRLNIPIHNIRTKNMCAPNVERNMRKIGIWRNTNRNIDKR